MPSDIAVIRNLTFEKNGSGTPTDLQDWPRIFCQLRPDSAPGAHPEVRGADVPIPYRDGQLAMARRANRLVVTIVGAVAGEGDDEAEQRSDTATARAEIFALFDPTAGEGTLACTTEDGSNWTLACRPDPIVWDADPVVPTYQTFTVTLVAVDPPAWEAGAS